jgi:rubrerythrin
MALDLDAFLRTSRRVETDDLDLELAFTSRPLDPDSLRCLRYMHDIESHTVCYLRDVLVTRSHRDPGVTAFLTAWNYEEHFHGEALARVLQIHDEPAGRHRVAGVRRERAGRDSARPLAFQLASGVLPDITAIHMTWGAINELTTQAGYARLAAKAGHPTLTEMLKRIMRQEGRHTDMYVAEARRRLAGRRWVQRTTRFALDRFWNPVGSGVRPRHEVEFVVRHLFGDRAGGDAASRIDRHLDRLPGLAGLHLVARARHRFGAT